MELQEATPREAQIQTDHRHEWGLTTGGFHVCTNRDLFTHGHKPTGIPMQWVNARYGRTVDIPELPEVAILGMGTVTLDIRIRPNSEDSHKIWVFNVRHINAPGFAFAGLLSRPDLEAGGIILDDLPATN